MRLAIMQPYIFPYIGYFQLIAAVDCFVIHDDAQWIKGGWINRNRILVHGQPHYITLPLQKNSSFTNINQRHFSADIEARKKKLLRQIEGAYRKAPYFDAVLCLVSRCFAYKEENVLRFVVNSLCECCDHLRIEKRFVLSSQIAKRNELKAEARVLDINRVMGASHYINPIGGTGLYEKERFASMGVRLSFMRTRNVPYTQFQNEFVQLGR